MSVAAETRRAVRADPAVYDALAAGVVNYSAAARSLDVEGDEESVATALRRFAEELESPAASDRRVSVRLHRGVAIDDASQGGISLDADGDAAAIEVTGDAGPDALEATLGRLRTANLNVRAATATADRLVVAVDGRAGAEALRVVEGALETA